VVSCFLSTTSTLVEGVDDSALAAAISLLTSVALSLLSTESSDVSVVLLVNSVVASLGKVDASTSVSLSVSTSARA